MVQPVKNLVDQLVEMYLPPPPQASRSPLADRLMNARWPEARWDIAGAFIHDEVLLQLLQLFAREFQFQPFGQVSGVPACLWAGGRSRGLQLRPPAPRQLIQGYDALQVAVNLVFSNCQLGPGHLGDTFGNYLLASLAEFNHTGHNGVVLGSDSLAAHVRQHYPALKRIASVARVVQDGQGPRLDLYRRLAEQYDQVVIHPDDNLDLNLLEKLEDKDKYKIVLNECCLHGCPRRRQHYELVSAQFLDYLDAGLEMAERDLVREIGCGHDLDKLLLSPGERTVTLSKNECGRLYDLGFRNFKIQGRGLKTGQALLFQIVHWLLNDDPRTDSISSRLVMEFQFLSRADKQRPCRGIRG